MGWRLYQGRPVRLRALALVSVLIFVAVTAIFVGEVGATPVVPWSIWQKVLKVHNCEQPNWSAVGPTYSGGLGWHNDLWLRFRAPWMPLNAGRASPLNQAWAMAHFVTQMNHGYWPDQRGCNGGY